VIFFFKKKIDFQINDDEVDCSSEEEQPKKPDIDNSEEHPKVSFS